MYYLGITYAIQKKIGGLTYLFKDDVLSELDEIKQKLNFLLYLKI